MHYLEPLKKPIELMPHRDRIREGLSYLPIIPIVLRWKNLTLGEYLKRYKNDFVRKTLRVIAGNEQMSALVLPMVLAFRAARYRLCRRRFLGFCHGHCRPLPDLGGVFRYNTKVTRIQIENDRALGVECEDGTSTSASTVVSCADGYTTIFKMLDGRFVG